MIWPFAYHDGRSRRLYEISLTTMLSPASLIASNHPVYDRSMAAAQVWVLSLIGSQSHTNPLTVIHPLPFTIGRAAGSKLQICSRTVSSQHARIIAGSNGLVLEDLGSTNGTFVNGERILDRVDLAGGDYIQFADVAFRVQCDVASTSTHTESHDACDQALALVQFDRMMQNRSVSPYFQPIVKLDDHGIVGYEILARSRLLGLESPAAMFDAAGKLNMECELSAMLRWEAIHQNLDVPMNGHFYLNTHPREVDSPQLAEDLRRLRAAAPSRPMVLEIHEAAVTSPQRMNELRAQLQSLDILLAYDDFGAGQNRLTELSECPPDVLKFDMSLIRNLDQAPVERCRLVAGLVKMVTELGVIALAEGVETAGEAKICREIGFELGQGYYYGRPAPPPRG